MANMKILIQLLEEIQHPTYLRAYKKRDAKIEEIKIAAKDLRKSQLFSVGQKIIKSLYFRVRQKRLSFSTLYKLLDILRIFEMPELYRILEDEIIGFVHENKYKAHWFLILLLKIKNKMDGDTGLLQDVYINRYLLPNRSGRIDSSFLYDYYDNIKFLDRSKLFRNCIKYKERSDSYGKNILFVFYELYPEYKKYSVLE